MPHQMPPEPDHAPKAMGRKPSVLDLDGALFHLGCAIHNLEETKSMITDLGHKFWINSAIKDINQVRDHVSGAKR